MSNEKSCAACPVSTGTHKPAEAVHQIDEPQTDALDLADKLEKDVWQATPLRLSKVVELAAEALRAQHARIAELEQRLEIDPRHRYDGISARDATIKAQDERIAELESQLEAIGAGGVEPLRKQAAQAVQAAVPVAWRLTNTAFRKPRFEYHDTKESAELRQADFNRSVDDGGLHNLTPLYAAFAATQPAAQGVEKSACGYPELPAGSEACEFNSYAIVYDADEMREYVDADRRMRAALAAQAKQGGK